MATHSWVCLETDKEYWSSECAAVRDAWSRERVLELCAPYMPGGAHDKCAGSCCSEVQWHFRPGADVKTSERSCAPSGAETRALFDVKQGVVPPCTPFYIDEEGDLSFRQLEECVLRVNNIPSGDVRQYLAHNWPPGAEEHLTGWLLLDSLRSHPMRSMDPQVPVHFTGILPLLSFFMSDGCTFKWPLEEKSSWEHTQRMERATSALRERLERLENDAHRVYVVFVSFWERSNVVSREMMKLANSRLGQRHVLLANQDHEWSADAPHNHVTIPYVPTFQLDVASHDEDALCDPAQRKYSIFFAGTMLRTGKGELRAGVMAQIAAVTEQSLIAYYTYPDPTLDTYAASEEYAARMRSSHFCLVAAGDSPTSRRLFDAIAAGCTPVYLGSSEELARPWEEDGQSNLPYPGVINWTSLVIPAGSLSCLSTNNFEGARSLARKLEEFVQSAQPHVLEGACRERVRVFQRYMSFIAARAVINSSSARRCSVGCLADTSPWRSKCHSGQCKDCTMCHASDSPSDKCEGWCAQHTSSWAAKCTWETYACSGCWQCAQPISSEGAGAATGLLHEIYRRRIDPAFQSSVACASPPAQPPLPLPPLSPPPLLWLPPAPPWAGPSAPSVLEQHLTKLTPTPSFSSTRSATDPSIQHGLFDVSNPFVAGIALGIAIFSLLFSRLTYHQSSARVCGWISGRSSQIIPPEETDNDTNIIVELEARRAREAGKAGSEAYARVSS